jgi:hypothetical protein
MQINNTIDLGQIVTVVTVALGLVGGYYTLKSDVIQIQKEMVVLRAASVEYTKTQSELTTKMIDALSSIRQDIAVMRARSELQNVPPELRKR